MKNPIEKMKMTHARMETVLTELSVLEDFEGADYSEVEVDYMWIVQQLEHRRTTLQKRGRTL